ncbi:unnamed protein product [Rotaria socialis]
MNNHCKIIICKIFVHIYQTAIILLFFFVDLLLSFFCSRYSIMMLGMIGKWLRIKLGATYNYLIMFYCIRVSINNNKMYVHIDQQQ